MPEIKNIINDIKFVHMIFQNINLQLSCRILKIIINIKYLHENQYLTINLIKVTEVDTICIYFKYIQHMHITTNKKMSN